MARSLDQTDDPDFVIDLGIKEIRDRLDCIESDKKEFLRIMKASAFDFIEINERIGRLEETVKANNPDGFLEK